MGDILKVSLIIMFITCGVLVIMEMVTPNNPIAIKPLIWENPIDDELSAEVGDFMATIFPDDSGKVHLSIYLYNKRNEQMEDSIPPLRSVDAAKLFASAKYKEFVNGLIDTYLIKQ